MAVPDNEFLWQFDTEQGEFSALCGIDEVGRGPLAGPVCAACVMLPEGLRIPYLNDSKKITEKRRELIYEQLIAEPGVVYGIGFASEQEIDTVNILQATFRAMNRAYTAMLEKLPEGKAPVLALVDGNADPHLPVTTRLVVKGDAHSAHIAAASVLAKVSRDRLMREYAVQYPEYAFENNKGYGSAEHYRALEQYGLTPIHRRSFLKKLLEDEE